MAETQYDRKSEVVLLEAGEAFIQERMVVEKIVFTADTFGIFEFNVGNAYMMFEMSVDPTMTIVLNRSVNKIDFLSGPIAGKFGGPSLAWVFLGTKEIEDRRRGRRDYCEL